jgi:hypothetical protein
MFNLATQPFGPTKGEYYSKCRKIKTNRNGFWTECFDEYADTEKSLRRLIEKFRDSDFEIAPCKGIKK